MPSPQDPSLTTPLWPEIQDGYVDEFGPVDPELYQIAANLWPSARTRILRAINDLDAGQRLMMKAVAIASRRRGEQPEQMTNLPAYLSVIFGNLLLDASRKQSGQDQLDDEIAANLGMPIGGSDAVIEQTILVREVLARADEWTKEVYEYRILGYTFEELAPRFKMEPNGLRSAWSKKMARLRKQIEKETKAARLRILQKRDRGF